MKYLVAILIILITTSASSQTPFMDSLKRQLHLNTVQDSQRVLSLADLAVRMAYVRPDSAIIYAQEGMSLAKKLGYVTGEMYCKKAVGEAMWTAGEYSIANALLLNVLNYAKSVNDAHWQIIVYAILSANSRDQGTYEEALKYSFKAIDVTKARKQLSTQEEWVLSYLEAGADYVEIGRLDSALYYLQQVSVFEHDAHSGYNGFKYLMMGRAYEKMGNAILALKYYVLSIETLSGTNNYKDVATAYKNIARIYDIEGKIDSCIYYAKKGFEVAQKGSFKKGIFETSLLLSGIYEKKDARLSLTYFKLATAAKDSMFNLQKTTQFLNSQFNEQLRSQEEAARRRNYQNKMRTYTLLVVLVFSLLTAIILYRNNRHKQKAKVEIEKAYKHLKATQAQLIQSEKMASLGELTAGIAHEIQNPLNFVNNFSEVSIELVSEQEQVIKEGNTQETAAIGKEIKDNLQKIYHHGKRADAIVKSMLEHSRTSKGEKQPNNINTLLDEYLRLAYHGFRAKDKSFNASIETHFDERIGKVNIIPQDIGRVLLNLFNNAFYTVNEKRKQAGEGYEPIVSVSTKSLQDKLEIKVQDNGMGIPKGLVDKIFQPFFTTKPTGEGTGLGLSLSYDIIKAHGGELKVESQEGKGTAFTFSIPIIS